MVRSHGGQPAISFIMPVYNVCIDWVHDAVQSVLSLDVDNELILIDDGSSDSDLVDYLVHAAEADSGVRYVRQDNHGVAAARNTGLSCARGRWITFIDPDDRVEGPQHWGDLADISDVDVVVGGAQGFAAQGGTATEQYSLRPLISQRVTAAELLHEMMSLYRVGRESAAFVIGVPWAKLVSREFLDRHGLQFDESIVKRSDAEWILRLLGAEPRIAVVDESIVGYRMDIPGSISNKFQLEILDGYERLMHTARTQTTLDELELELYAVELLKDAINNVFTNPVAPAHLVSRERYRDYRAKFPVSGRVWTRGLLRGANIGRKALFVVIWRRWYPPVWLLRSIKKRKCTH